LHVVGWQAQSSRLVRICWVLVQTTPLTLLPESMSAQLMQPDSVSAWHAAYCDAQ
jgi:hypothetical protein